jgi:Kef-type K+ transport system membrane component KefB
MTLNIIALQLPLTDPILKFLIILVIILGIPILSEKLKVPHLLGMILSGVIIGPYALNLIARDSSIILSGTAGLLYIMFLSGLEIDMNDFRRNALKSTILGLFGFTIPMGLGIGAGLYLLNYSLNTSVLLASMFASHTLITYPIVSKLGIARNKAVNISVGSTMISNVLALLVLAVIVGMYKGDVNREFWIKLSVSFIVFTGIILFLFPVIARWFFKKYSDSVSQYIFVLVMVFSGAVLSRAAGIEPIIGAFMAGLALNRLVPGTSPLMNRIDFVGNAIFIPFFLIGVGMLIDFRAFTSLSTIFVAFVMSFIAVIGKIIAAWLTQKSFRFSKDEGILIFGLTGSQAAATLAAVLVGYNIIIGYGQYGEPVRLLNEDVLNGTVIMILVTCTIASFATQKSAQRISISKEPGNIPDRPVEKILIPISNPNNISELVNMSTILKSKYNRDELYAVNIINLEDIDTKSEKEAKDMLYKAKVTASATDIALKTFVRYDINVVQGITGVIREHRITDLVLGLHSSKGITDTFLGNLTDGILAKNHVTTYIYRPFQPVSTIKRHIVIIPENAEYETGFSFWLSKIWNIYHNTGAAIIFYASEHTLKLLGEVCLQHPLKHEMHVFTNWDDILILSRDIREDDSITIIFSRKNMLSYKPAMNKIPGYLNRYFQTHNFLLIYPIQSALYKDDEMMDLTNPSLIETIEKIDDIGKTVAGIFRRKKETN